MTKGVLPVRIIVCSLWLMAAGAGFGLLFNSHSNQDSMDESPDNVPSIAGKSTANGLALPDSRSASTNGASQ